jgi:hypothetical protein
MLRSVEPIWKTFEARLHARVLAASEAALATLVQRADFRIALGLRSSIPLAQIELVLAYLPDTTI